MIWKFATAALLVATCVKFAWPWVQPYLDRRDQPGRFLDRLVEEWEREHDEPAPRFDGMPW